MESIEFKNQTQIENVELLIIPFSKKVKSFFFAEIDRALEGGATAALQAASFKGKVGEICILTTNGKYPIPRILLVGVEESSALQLQKLGGNLVENIGNAQNIGVDGSFSGSLSILFGIMLRSFKIPCYQTKNKVKKETWIYLSENPEKSSKLFEESQKLLQSIALARTLTSAPSNKLTPQLYAEKCKELASTGLIVEILAKEELEKQGFHAILAVGKGSVNSPYVVTLRWEGGQGDPIAFVGKGVCFDSGGINIKTQHLLEMKWDKAGAGAVVGIMNMLAISKAPVNAIGVIGLVENMVDGGALKPGDVISTHSGLTVEVIDTDNEGRLVLCDCLSHVQTIVQPSVIVDLGTLTLETFGALAGEYAGLYCNDEVLEKQLIEAGELSGERVWPLPMGETFAKQIESEEADIKNCGVLGFGEGGAAAEFLRCFVKPGVRWAHLDISGVAWTQEHQILCPKGVTGYGVRLLNALIQKIYS